MQSAGRDEGRTRDVAQEVEPIIVVDTTSAGEVITGILVKVSAD